MWAKNGAQFLPSVLKRIDESMPEEMRGQKIFVDDHSSDASAKIARGFNWEVHTNLKGGIGNGANLALSRVKTEYFASFEQDVLLNKEGRDKVLPASGRPKVAVVQGWRYSTNQALLDLEIGVPSVKFRLYSIDNNLYRTGVIRSVGGFPTYVNYCIDGVLRSLVIRAGWEWVTDLSLVSVHMKPMSLIHYARSAENKGRDYAVASRIFLEEERRKMTLPYLTYALVRSPMIGMGVSILKRNPLLAWYFPLEKFLKLKGYLKAGAHA